MEPQRHEFTREQLYELVWSEPMSRVCERFAISDVGLKKICRRHSIPVPGRGYWRKLETGKKVKRLPLPKSSEASTVILRSQTQQEAEQQRETERKTQEALKIEEQAENKIEVAQRLSSPHPLTVATRKELEKWVDPYGMARCRAQNLFRVLVAEGNIPRAGRIMDAIYKAFDKRGLKIKPATWDRGDASVIIDQEEVQFSLDEPTRQKPHQLTAQEKRDAEKYGSSWSPKYDYVSAGQLVLKITSYYWGTGLRTTWKDQPDSPLEDKLGEFMAGLMLVASYRRQETLRREAEERRREEALARQREVQRRKDAEAKATRELFEDADRWHQVQRLEAYLTELRAEADRRGIAVGPDDAFGKWIAWAEEKAQWRNPLIAMFNEDKWEMPT